MSKRREAGEIVRKAPMAGFIGVPCLIRLEAEDDREPCILDCGDDDCCGWSNCRVIEDDGTPTPHYAYHVFECQMEDVAPVAGPAGGPEDSGEGCDA